LWISYFFQIFTLIGSSVICLSLSKIPLWTHQREFGLTSACPEQTTHRSYVFPYK
jgi:hypothetical protein